MRKSKSLIAIFMAALMLCTAFPAFGSSIGSVANDPSVGEDTAQGAQTEYAEVGAGQYSTDVFLTVDNSNIKVGVPTVIILNGTPTATGEYKGKYTVSVEGDMSGDSTLMVQPKENSFTLAQNGKDDMNAMISQEKTAFSSEDLANEVQTTGEVSAVGLTAGSWHGQTSFLIQMVSRYVYYSSIELAASDASNLTTENADIAREDVNNAEAALYISGDTAYVKLLKSVDNTAAFTFSEDTVFDMSSNTIGFTKGAYLTYEKDFTIRNGSINVSDSNYAVRGAAANTDGVLNVNNMSLSGTVDASMSSNMILLDSSCVENNVSNSNLKISGTGHTSYSAIDIALRNPSGANTIDESSLVIDVDTGRNVYGIQNQGGTVFNDPEISVSTNTASGSVGGIMMNPTGDVGKPVTVNGGNVFVEAVEKEDGCAINGNTTTGQLTINDVTLFGKQWGVQCSPLAKTVIRGGVYTSTDHIVYTGGDLDAYDAWFHIDRRDEYTSLSSPYGIYLGSTYAEAYDSVVNFYNCIIGNSNEERQLCSALSSKGSNGGTYYDVAECNIYDSDLYGSASGVFQYTLSKPELTKHLNHTKFNLYGDTHLYSYDNSTQSRYELTTEMIEELNATWRTTKRYSTSTSAGSQIGNQLVLVTGAVGIINDDGSVNPDYVTIAEDAGVYDYRDIA